MILSGSVEAVSSAFHNMLHTMGIAGTVREVWTDNGKQFVSAAFEALLRSVLPGVRHRFIPSYAPYAGGFYEVQHRTLNQTLRAVLAVTPVEHWQKLCDFAMEKINGCSTNGGPSPAELWFVRPHEVAADRVILAPFSTRMPEEGEEERVDNHGASGRDKLV